MLFIDQYAHYILSYQSDPIIVAFCLGAVDAHLCGRPRLAFVCLVFASLGRPEAWPFAGLYAVWLWRSVPSARVVVAVGLAVIPALWFGVPMITNGRPFVAGQLADNSVHRIVGNKFTGTYDRYVSLTLLPIQLLALVAVGIAAARRNRTVLVLAAAAVLWVLVELAFALHGWPALPRYMFESAAIQCVLAGVAIGWVALALPRLAIPAAARRLPRWASVPVALALALTVVPGAIGRARADQTDLKREHWRTTQIARLAETIAAVGGRHVLACGKPVTYVGLVSALAYQVTLNVGVVGHQPNHDLQRHTPVVLFTPGAIGWAVDTAHLHRRTRRSAPASTRPSSSTAVTRVDSWSATKSPAGFSEASDRATRPPAPTQPRLRQQRHDRAGRDVVLLAGDSPDLSVRLTSERTGTLVVLTGLLLGGGAGGSSRGATTGRRRSDALRPPCAQASANSPRRCRIR